jgi:hypothetical protein
MAILNLNDTSQNNVVLAHRNDECFLCKKKARNEAKNLDEYDEKLKEMKGKLEGQKVLKINRSGQELVVCMKCIHEIADENPIEESNEDNE